jgi:hypothetical protein
MSDPTKSVTTNGRPDPQASFVKSKSSRPFAKAMKSYKKDFLEKALLKAIAQLAGETDLSRYARVKIPLFSVIEVDVDLPNGELKTYSYPIHKVHYGPINKSVVDYIPFAPGTSADFIRAAKFCYRDPLIWLEVNGEGKVPGGDGTGFGNTACSPFRDAQVRLSEQGYYLVDLSEYIFDEDKNKWYFKIDIRMYQDVEAVAANPNLWHQYGVIPGLGPLRRQAEAEAETETEAAADDAVDHGDLDVEKAVPKGGE